MSWTVQVSLLGRHDGADVTGICTSRRVGEFDSYAEARQAVLSWESDTTFVFKARAIERRRRNSKRTLTAVPHGKTEK